MGFMYRARSIGNRRREDEWGWAPRAAAAVCIALAALPGLARAQAPSTELVSASTSNASGNYASERVCASGDGRWIAFSSRATDLAPNVTYGTSFNAFLRDRQSGSTQLVSHSLAGSLVAGNDDSFVHDISDDGRYVAFGSDATDLVPNDTNGVQDCFVWDAQTGAIERVSVDAFGNQAEGGDSGNPSISDDGAYVAFESSATNLSPVGSNLFNVYRWSRASGATTPVSESFTAQGATGSNPSISADGTYVAFHAGHDLIPADTNGQVDCYVRNCNASGAAAYLLASIETGGELGDGASTLARISADGLHVAFQSRATNLDGLDQNGSEQDIYVHDWPAWGQAGTTRRVSVSSTGGQGTVPGAASGYPVLSANGRYVAFHSYDAGLVPSDTNGIADVYLHDRDVDDNGVYDEPSAIATRRVSVSSGGVEATHVGGGSFRYVPGLATNGRYVVFESTCSNLVTNDTNAVNDVFFHDDGAGPPWCWTYCTAKTSSLGCVPAIACSGTPSTAAGAAPFLVTASQIIGGKFGLVFYGFCGNDNAFDGGWLCVKQQILRGPIQSSGGAANTCTGTFSYDFTPLIQAGQPSSLTAGADVFAQYWYRDPASPSTTGLTDAVWFRIQP